MKIKHTPCITDDDVIHRLLEDQMEIKIMRDEGHPIRTMVSYQSRTTFECHCIPIFKSDKLEDICNRYYDFFPKECSALLEEIKVINQSLYSGTGMSEFKTMMAFGKIPFGLQKMLDVWAGGDFLAPDVKKRNLKRLFSYMPKLKIGTSYGKTQFAT